MRLTAYTDYTLRTLMYLGLNQDKLVTIHDIAELHNISKNHLMKVVHQLGLSGMVETVRGRHGGLRLNRTPEHINIGEIVRNTESDFYMAECFNPESNSCGYAPSCTLKGILSSALHRVLCVNATAICTLEILYSSAINPFLSTALSLIPPYAG